MTAPLGRRLLAEFLGSAFLAAVVIGSGIAAQRLSPGDVGLELFENAAATAAGLFAIILMFGPVSGGALQPGRLARRRAASAGFAGATRSPTSRRRSPAASPARSPPTRCSRSPPVSISTKHRASPAHLLAEVIATLGLLLVIFSLARTQRAAPQRPPPSAPTSARRTSSPARPASPTPRSPSAACSPTPSPASPPRRCPDSWSRSSSAASSRSSCSGRSTRTSRRAGGRRDVMSTARTPRRHARP